MSFTSGQLIILSCLLFTITNITKSLVFSSTITLIMAASNTIAVEYHRPWENSFEIRLLREIRIEAARWEERVERHISLRLDPNYVTNMTERIELCSEYLWINHREMRIPLDQPREIRIPLDQPNAVWGSPTCRAQQESRCPLRALSIFVKGERGM